MNTTKTTKFRKLRSKYKKTIEIKLDEFKSNNTDLIADWENENNKKFSEKDYIEIVHKYFDKCYPVLINEKAGITFPYQIRIQCIQKVIRKKTNNYINKVNLKNYHSDLMSYTFVGFLEEKNKLLNRKKPSRLVKNLQLFIFEACKKLRTNLISTVYKNEKKRSSEVYRLGSLNKIL